jgi:hypothetical protein
VAAGRRRIVGGSFATSWAFGPFGLSQKDIKNPTPVLANRQFPIKLILAKIQELIQLLIYRPKAPLVLSTIHALQAKFRIHFLFSVKKIPSNHFSGRPLPVCHFLRQNKKSNDII